jgi:Fe2+ or Zn2+ uptake regulation protein
MNNGNYGITETIKGVVAITRLFATRNHITVKDARAAIKSTGREVSVRTVQRVLQHMCAAGVLVQARPLGNNKPAQFYLAEVQS